MQLTEHIRIRVERPARPKRRRPRHRTRPTRDQARVGAPQDRATYSCGCGYVFVADVTTSVGCPHCGSEHAW
jgi:hypothetical protein